MNSSPKPNRFKIEPTKTNFWLYCNLAIAATAMVATFPGRTQGLGMITETVLEDLSISRAFYATINLWATLLGALFCFPVGRAIDRFGCRKTLAVVLVFLTFSVLATALSSGWISFFLAMILTRGFGQSALSIVSITLAAKTFLRRRLGLAMAWFNLMVSIGFLIAFALASFLLTRAGLDWRSTWGAIGGALGLVVLPISWFGTTDELAETSPDLQNDKIPSERQNPEIPLERQNPKPLFDRQNPKIPLERQNSESPLERQNSEIPLERQNLEANAARTDDGVSFARALKTPAFWFFSLSISLYGLAVSGIGLFNENIFQERGFDVSVYHRSLMLGVVSALAFQFLAGWISKRSSISRVLGVALWVLGGSLLWFPSIQTTTEIYFYVFLKGAVGGVIAIVFYAIWGEVFGGRDLGRIQGIAQLFTVLASAFGPLLFAWSLDRFQSYSPTFQMLAPFAFLLGFGCYFAKLPRENEPDSERKPNATETKER